MAVVAFFVCLALILGDSKVEGESVIEAVRLVGGITDSEGRVEVLLGGRWGTVCGYFDDNAASVVCRSLGMRSGFSRVVAPRIYGPGDGPIISDAFVCIGNETSLSTCGHSDIGRHSCEHSQDIGVACGGTVPRYIAGVRLVGGARQQEGRLEVLINGTWGIVCDDRFNPLDAAVVCRMLGYQTRWGTVFPRAFFGEGSGPMLIDDTQCRGFEDHLDFCYFNTRPNCQRSEAVGVRCD